MNVTQTDLLRIAARYKELKAEMAVFEKKMSAGIRGPASSVDNRLVLWDGTNGDKLKMSSLDGGDLWHKGNVKFAYGFIIITPVANEMTGAAIDYSSAGFVNPPHVVATASSASTAVQIVTCGSVEEDSAMIYLRRTNTTATGVYWIAIGV